MTDLLARQGNLDGSIRLEELWNELAETYTFSLLCAYSLGAFSEDTHDAALRAICNQHAHVLPTERYMRVDDGALYTSLHRLEARRLVRAEWGVSENNRRAKYYELTAAGRRELAAESDRWNRYTAAVSRVLRTA